MFLFWSLLSPIWISHGNNDNGQLLSDGKLENKIGMANQIVGQPHNYTYVQYKI